MKQQFTFFPTLKMGHSRRFSQNLKPDASHHLFANSYPAWIPPFFKKNKPSAFVGSLTRTSILMGATDRNAGMHIRYVANDNRECAKTENIISTETINPLPEFTFLVKPDDLSIAVISHNCLKYVMKALMIESPASGNARFSHFTFLQPAISLRSNPWQWPLVI